MNFSSPEKVASVIQNLKDAERRRSPNRALVNALFNGAPPYTQAEAEENKIQWNVNWGEGSDLLLQGREQLENAHLSTDFAFTVRLPDAPKSKASQYAAEINRLVNRLLRESRPYFNTQRSKWGSVILHGTGAQMWYDSWAWRSHFIGIEDLLIPTDTDISLENLHHFAVRRRMSPGELFRKTFGKPEDKRDPGWKLKAVQKVLDQYVDLNQNQNSWNWSEHPEKMAELWKQNTLYYETDAVPTIWMWDFFFQEDDDPQPCWYRKIMLDKDCVPGRNAATAEDPIIYLYDSDKPHANRLDEILHVQFIDGNNVPPFMYHSCRGLGLRLHDSVQALNRLRCQFIQKVFEDMMLLFRAADPVDRSRLDRIYLGMNYGIIPEGLSFVTREQRYSPDPRLVEMQLANLKQLLGESSQQYTQDIDTGTNKERTAFEVNTMLQQTTRLTGSMLNLSYIQEGFAYREICRRLTLPDTLDWEAKKFQNDLLTAGVPRKWIDASKWEIETVRVLGSGNNQLEQAQAQAMINIRPMLNPEAQNEVLHDYVFAMTHDPKRANRLAPLDSAVKVTDAVHDTELAFGAIMSGSIVTPKPGLAPIEVIETTLRLMQQTVKGIQRTGNVGDWKQINGLHSAELYAKEWIDQLGQDKNQQERARSYSDMLNQIMNEVKAFAQRLAEADKKKAQEGDPETQKLRAELAAMQQKLLLEQQAAKLKLQTDAAAAQQKLAQEAAASRQKLSQAEQEHQLDMAMKNEEFRTDQQMAHVQAVQEVHNDSMTAAAEARRAEAEAEAAPEAE